MTTHTRRALLAAACFAGLAAFSAAGLAKAESVTGDALAQRLAGFEGLWLVGPPGGDRRGPPPGERGERRSPPPGADGRFGRGGSGGGGLRPGGPPPGVEPGEGPAELRAIEGLDRGDLRVWSLMTPDGRAAFAAMNPHDLPANNCRSAGLPHIAGAPGLQEWSVEDGVLTIRHEFSSAVRRIDLSETAHPAGGAHTPGGHAIARMEGDTLVIETAQLAPTPGGLARNAPSSGSRTVTERYRLAPDGSGLSGDMTIHDPEFLRQDMTMPVRLRAAEPGTELIVFPCSVEAAQRHLD